MSFQNIERVKHNDVEDLPLRNNWTYSESEKKNKIFVICCLWFTNPCDTSSHTWGVGDNTILLKVITVNVDKILILGIEKNWV